MKSKTVAIVQSNYIPWKGYFDLINKVNEFILFDDVQYTARDWRNRNLIKTPQGCIWLTIPLTKSPRSTKIKDKKIADHNWGKRHWQILTDHYAKAPYFSTFREIFADLYLNSREVYLSQINFKFIKAINKLLKIKTKISWSSDYEFVSGKTARLISLCQQTGATQYISGPKAKSYIAASLFRKANVRLTWMDYANYPRYNQLYPPFVHEVSVLDLLFHTGPQARKYLNTASRPRRI
ncbi:MAG: hypothetical protein UV55_C0025G0009 [Candidatus Gottesmanbacteria bacterium GW2011_GWC1_43_10]|nr:MAG: hypothetical protein UV04_C0019G0009 [Candidatus Gottesmanbacteria bacterium GW2011_GWA2_42_16]KKS54315.1 MAG: hypothetical protein UV17_C0021G0009 [Candidatus Gottesmanbacteria bacterium GW2011_GWA1_42_26]KKS80946.1 MAG: hypothetical protein UV55_C0025G0009 [Candidatus Gottesmanbacteria bacterium GW2011_GWC1_43_10]OGG08535.1 MAG: hypothetical protein A2699_03365 [Candidatus Gottesmanbacteria bacterium RIFCSPHIGHO2_01_FULL_43_15]HCM37299.1 hypothetical protein [Patescibacteria group bac